MTQDWRACEQKLLDCFRLMGIPLCIDQGVTFVVDHYYDGDTGELLRRHYVLNIQELAQRLTTD